MSKLRDFTLGAEHATYSVQDPGFQNLIERVGSPRDDLHGLREVGDHEEVLSRVNRKKGIYFELE